MMGDAPLGGPAFQPLHPTLTCCKTAGEGMTCSVRRRTRRAAVAQLRIQIQPVQAFDFQRVETVRQGWPSSEVLYHLEPTDANARRSEVEEFATLLKECVLESR